MGEHRRFFLGTASAGLLLRLLFLAYFPAVTDDSRIYADLATNWLQHGVYGLTQGGHPEKPILPTDTRLPGYPGFLAAIFWICGAGNFKAALVVQILFDLSTCLIVADFARRTVSDRAAKIAFVLTALCPFLANYAPAVLTETLEVFFTAVALDCAAAALNSKTRDRTASLRLWAATGLAIAACILLRPDGGILLAAVICCLAVAVIKDLIDGGKRTGEIIAAGVLVVAFALAPLVPWTIRNLRTLQQFQPLAPRYANESDELVPRGFNRWVKTWMIDYTSVEEIYWNVPGEKIKPDKLPSRAFDSAQRDSTLAAIADYNETQDMTPELDARFEIIAAERIRARAVRYYLTLPMLRVVDMWMRPRTELLPPDPRWWEFHDDTKQSVIAVGFGLLNLTYVIAAVVSIVRIMLRRVPPVRGIGLFVIFLLLRSAFLATLENPEPRYTLECYPVIILLAAICFSHFHKKTKTATPRI